jgi:hypothetical protein
MRSWTSYAGIIGMMLGAMTLGTRDARAQDRVASVQQTEDANAPMTEKDEVLLSGKVHHGGYGAPHVKLTTVAGHAGLLVGGEGAWIIAHSLLLGGGGYGLVTSTDAPEEARSTFGSNTLTLGYGGVRVGYIIAPHDLWHVTASLLIGGGGVSVVERNGSDTRTYRSASVFALEPDIALELNVAPMIRAGVDASYRYMSDSGIPGLSRSQIGGPAAGVLVAFGWF